MRATLTAVLLSLLVAGCASSGSRPSPSGDLEVRGWESRTWTDGNGARDPNFDFVYETTARKGSEDSPFHHMKTRVQLGYDPLTGEVHNARISSSETGHALRHVCLTPAGDVLRIRMTTLLDGRGEDLTVLNLHEQEITMHGCEEVGIGPADGLVESLDVIFHPDGTWQVLPATGAHLTSAGVRFERRMTADDGSDQRSLSVWP